MVSKALKKTWNHVDIKVQHMKLHIQTHNDEIIDRALESLMAAMILGLSAGAMLVALAFVAGLPL